MHLRTALRAGSVWLLAGVSLALCAATALGFVGRYWWVLDLASHFRVQYFWLFAAACAASFALRLWRWGLVNLGGLAINGGLVLPLMLAPRPAVSTEGQPLRVVAFNVWHTNRQFERVCTFIRETDADVAVFTEVSRKWGEALHALDDTYPYSRELPIGSFGVAVYSKIPFDKFEFHLLSDGCPMACAQLRMGDARVALWGVHAFSPPGAELTADRNQQLQSLGDLAGECELPLVVIGDLNTTSWSWIFPDLIRRSHLRDSRWGFGVQPSWDGGLPWPVVPIDHCLVSDGIAVENRQIGPYVGSDHRPLIVDLRIPKSR
jgi:endonuclease/exonuclease/phosphatase (EEP) superfamily protein YafD